MKLMPMIVHSLVLLGGLIFVYFAWLQFQKTHLLLSKGIMTTATVVENVTVPVKNNITYKPRFQYMDQNHQPAQFMGEVNTSPPAWSIGETATVIYLPGQPGSVRIMTYWNLFRSSILLAAASAPFFVIGLGYFLYFFFSRSWVISG